MTQRDILDAMIERVNESECDWWRKRDERIKRQERLAWLITIVLFGFIALALFCGPASAL